MSGAIFLDRDGTINVQSAPHQHVTTREQFRFLPGAFDALAFLSKNSERRIVIVTNQSCIGRGTATWKQVLSLHDWMEQQIEKAGGHLDGVFVCPHRPEEACACRKPKPALLQLAAVDLDLDLSRSVMIGDSRTDLLAGWAAGVPKCYYILRGRDRAPILKEGSYRIVDSLLDAAQDIARAEHVQLELEATK